MENNVYLRNIKRNNLDAKFWERMKFSLCPCPYICSPRYTEKLAHNIKMIGGARYMFLTHRYVAISSLILLNA